MVNQCLHGVLVLPQELLGWKGWVFFPHVMKGESWICRKWGWRRINHQMKPEKGNNNLREEFTIQDPG
jgi:hypothetical protein